MYLSVCLSAYSYQIGNVIGFAWLIFQRFYMMYSICFNNVIIGI